ncbi:hypothetical protein JYU29_06005 [Tianweitania sp. BSSL-BM11]|uniref:Uncharacterized protein n=1 Tax=Tianweitania aestuarii TaxID=2814886 RepID=A0ABS5RT55_9HYPH|nr:hypothetical protein [Tianweitania aestuarii]MBS9720238.1 hypothetical protein [Tianweitania aestuarii]
MKPQKVTRETEFAERQKAMCDTIIERAAHMMVGEVGVTVPTMLDRMLTYCGAQACTIDGSKNTAEAFRTMADRIEAGLFHPLTGEDLPSKDKH